MGPRAGRAPVRRGPSDGELQHQSLHRHPGRARRDPAALPPRSGRDSHVPDSPGRGPSARPRGSRRPGLCGAGRRDARRRPPRRARRPAARAPRRIERRDLPSRRWRPADPQARGRVPRGAAGARERNALRADVPRRQLPRARRVEGDRRDRHRGGRDAGQYRARSRPEPSADRLPDRTGRESAPAARRPRCLCAPGRTRGGRPDEWAAPAGRGPVPLERPRSGRGRHARRRWGRELDGGNRNRGRRDARGKPASHDAPRSRRHPDSGAIRPACRSPGDRDTRPRRERARHAAQRVHRAADRAAAGPGHDPVRPRGGREPRRIPRARARPRQDGRRRVSRGGTRHRLARGAPRARGDGLAHRGGLPPRRRHALRLAIRRSGAALPLAGRRVRPRDRGARREPPLPTAHERPALGSRTHARARGRRPSRPPRPRPFS